MAAFNLLKFESVRLPNGLRMRYAESGPANGPVALMLHGYTDSWFSFSRVLPLMPPHLRVIVPDQRGHGDTDKPRFGYTIEQAACDAAQLLEALGAGSAMVIGHSMGSFVGQRLATLYPQYVSKLVLLASAARIGNDATVELARSVESLSDPVDPAFVREFQLSTIHRPVPPDFLDGVINESLKVPSLLWKWWLRGLLRSYLDTELGSIECPVLVLWGDRDSMFPRQEQDALVRRIPNARLKVMAGFGHAPHWEAPEIFAAEVAQFTQGRSLLSRAG